MKTAVSFGDWLVEYAYQGAEKCMSPEQAEYLGWCKKEFDRPKTAQERIKLQQLVESLA